MGCFSVGDLRTNCSGPRPSGSSWPATRRGARAFTLIEVLIVTLIVSILAAAVVRPLMIANEDTTLRAAAQQLRQLQRQSLAYQARWGVFADSLATVAGGEVPANLVHHGSRSNTAWEVNMPGRETPLNFFFRSDHHDQRTGWWYNAANGIIIARVPDSGLCGMSAEDTYRSVNGREPAH
ncbi:MAG: type II secretion system protein [Planctomycetota bacterium]